MKTNILISTLIVSALTLTGCAMESAETDPSNSAAPSQSETATPNPSESTDANEENVVTDGEEVTLKLGEQYPLESIISKEESDKYSVSFSDPSIVTYVTSEVKSYAPFLVSLAAGESLVYVTPSGDTKAKVSFKVIVNATAEETKTLQEAREIAAGLAGLTEAEAVAKVKASNNPAISHTVSSKDKPTVNEDYNLGRINIYLNESGKVEYAGVG